MSSIGPATMKNTSKNTPLKNAPRKNSIDLNLDAGESDAQLRSGLEERLYRLVSSINVACGGHAGTPETMAASIELALKHGLSIGAHPSYPDLENFGRSVLRMDLLSLRKSLENQILALNEVALKTGAKLTHVKPHGALYNEVAKGTDTADTFLEAVRRTGLRLRVIGLASSTFIEKAKAAGFEVAGEGFVDRNYESDGALRGRQFSDALIVDPDQAAEQALRLAKGEVISTVSGGSLLIDVQTLCIHGDHEEALGIAMQVRSKLTAAGFQIRSL